MNKQLQVVDTLTNDGSLSETTPYFEDEFKQYLYTGAETFSFQTMANTKESQHLVVGNYVAFMYEKQYKLFHITQIDEEHTEYFMKTVYGEMAGIELINDIIRPMDITNASLKKFLDNILSETDWKIGALDLSLNSVHDINIGDYTNVYGLLQEHITSTYGGEMSLTVDIIANRVVGKYVNVYFNRGRHNGFRFAYSSNISSVTRTVDSSNLATALIGVGKDNLTFKEIETPDKPLNQDFIADEYSYKIWNQNGSHIMGYEKFETESPQELLQLTREALKKRRNPNIKYELKTELLLGGEVSIGDTVNVVDHEFNPPIYLEARVNELTTSFTDPSKNECVLSNFVEINSNITDEMRKIASELEGFVEGSLDAKFPVAGEDIQQGAISSGHIYKSSITTGHLMAECVTADKIKAGEIISDHIQADTILSKHIETDTILSKHIQSEQILAEHIKSGTITADQIATGTITAESGVIADATIGTAQIKDAEITVAKIQNAFVDNLVATQGKFESAHIGKLTSDNIDANTINAEHITASVIDAINMNVSGKITADKIDVSDLVVDNIDAGKITTGTLDADRITSSVITSINASIENATINSAKIGNLSADKITSGEISADRISSNVITAINANIGSATINSAKIGELSADKITTGTLNADRISSNSIETKHLSSSTISAIEIGASKITADKIQSGEISVGNANIIDGSISGAKITNASISNAQIKDATIESAKIKQLDAQKINTGTLDATKVRIASSSGNLVLADNTMSISDANRIRVQVGKDNRGQYGVYVINSQGKAIFDSDKGVLVPEGLGNNVVTTDKIINGAVGSSKLNVDELFVGDNAFINSLKAVEINATQITTGKISNDRIDISGLVSFEALDNNLNNVFEIVDGKTFINGGMITTNKIKAEELNVKGLSVFNTRKEATFAVSKEGDIEVNGLLKSSNFSDEKNTGYRLTTDGVAILNQAQIRGDIILPTAGMTNYGATMGNENLLTNSDFSNGTTGWSISSSVSHEISNELNGGKKTLKISRTGLAEGNHWAGLTQTIPEFVGKSIKDIPLTISLDIYIKDPMKFNGPFSIELKGEREGSSDASYGSTTINPTDLNGKWTRVSFTINSKDDVLKSPYFYLWFLRNGEAWISNIKIEKDTKATPYCPNKNDQLDYVRVWAGKSYSERNDAPFKVTEKGELWTSNATVSGRVIGNIDAGKVHIHNDEIVINSTSTYVENNKIKNSTPFDSKPNPYMRFGEGTSFINTDFIFGNVGSKKVEFLNSNKQFNLFETDLNINSNGLTNIKFSAKESSGIFNGLNLIAKTGGGHHVLRHSSTTVNAGTLVFDSEGSQGINGDFCFTRKNFDEKCKVKIDGDLEISTRIKSHRQNIELRSVDNEGWGFFAV